MLTLTGMPVRRYQPFERSFWMSLTVAEREAYTRAAEECAFSSGTVLCREGSCSSQVIVLRSGWAKVSAHLLERERIVTVRGAGDVVGGSSVLTPRSRSAAVTALGEVVGLVMPMGRFLDLMAGHPPIRAALEHQERDRPAGGWEHLRGGGTTGVEHRLAYLLHALASRRGESSPAGTPLSLPVSQRDMARWVDAEAAEVGRVLDTWRRRGVVRTADRGLTVVDVRRLGALCDAREAPDWSALNRSILYTDVAGFSAPCRSEADRQVVRDRLYEILSGAFEDSGVSWAACYHEDRGDGVLIVVPPEIPTRAIADPLLTVLAAALRRHNRRAGAAVRIQLRAALHVGPVSRDAEGLNGDAIIHTARMLDAPPLREALRASDADLAFMASGHVFDTVLRDDAGLLDPSTFARVSFRIKESQITGWMHVAGSGPNVTVHQAEPTTTTRGDAAPPHITHFHEAVRVEGDIVVGSKVIGRG